MGMATIIVKLAVTVIAAFATVIVVLIFFMIWCNFTLAETMSIASTLITTVVMAFTFALVKIIIPFRPVRLLCRLYKPNNSNAQLRSIHHPNAW